MADTLTAGDTTTWHVETIETASLGDRSYVVHDGATAAVVDPQRDLDRVDAVLDELGLTVVAVVETHVHNDYVSGGPALAARTGAAYHVAAADELAVDRVPTHDGDRIAVGSLVLRAVHTPGHTPTHLSYVVEVDGDPVAVCTGGGLLFGSVGRTDLIAADLAEELARAQYRSAQRLAEELSDDVAVLPTHGFGSFCSSGDMSESVEHSTIGRERAANDAFTAPDEDTFVGELLEGLDAYPAYYAHMAPRNRAGAEAADLSPVEPVDVTELRRRIHAGEWVVDLRNRRAFADGHLVGTINLELDASASTYLGWLLPWDTPVTLVADRAEQVADLQRQLVRIGIDRPAGRADTSTALEGPRGRYRVTDFAGVRDALDGGDVTLLDTRRRLEWDEGHVSGARHVPLHDLLDRLDDLPPGTLLVHCASGYRASIGASLLARAGRDVVLVDDDVSRAADAGLPWVVEGS